MTVTVCFLTRNHGDCLGRALRSIPAEFSEILVVDTGSTDGTLSVAAEYARVEQIPWEDDFSAACNRALGLIQTDWVLWLNADEELLPGAAEPILEVIRHSRVFAARLPIRQILKAGQPDFATLVWESRLFRRDPGLRYVSRVHPHFDPPLEVLAHALGLEIALLPQLIDRHVYRNVITEEKIRWVIRLIEAERKDRPGQLGLDVEYGHNLVLIKDQRGEEVLRTCAEQLKPFADQPNPPDARVGLLLEQILNRPADRGEWPMPKAQARELGQRWFGNTPPVLWAIAAERYAAEDYASAVEPLRRLVELSQSGQYDSGGGFDPEILGANPLLNLGLCYLQLKNWLAAKTCLSSLFSHPVHGERAHRLFAHCEAQLRNQPSS